MFMTETHSSLDRILVGESASAQALGRAGGARGDQVDHLIVIPQTNAPGIVTLTDGSTDYPLYLGGSDATLKPFTIVVDLKSLTGAWKITTGAHVKVLAVGRFT